MNKRLLISFLTLWLVSSVCFLQSVIAQPGCPSIEAGSPVTLDCVTPCTNLTATALATGATTSYSVSSIPYAPPYPYNSGTPILVNIDDTWGTAISLPFNFCYYGNMYNQVVPGSNGVISFDLSYSGGYCPWMYSATCPSSALPLNSIYGVYHDIDPSVSGNMYYAILGNYPCRTFVVSWNQVAMYSCNYMIATHQIVLYESTNVIEVYIENKPLCSSWNSGNALVGIQDASGTIGLTPPGRNTSQWTATNEAWRFTPNGAPNYAISWYAGGTLIDTGATVNVCPISSTTYTAQCIYSNCDGTTITVSDNVDVTVNNSIGLTINPQNQTVCQGNAATIIASSTNPLTTYLWSNGDTNDTITVNPTGTQVYTVTATAPGCTTISTATVNALSPIPIEAGADTSICSGNSTQLNASGGLLYTWTPAIGLSSTSISNPLANPSSTTTYYVTSAVPVGNVIANGNFEAGNSGFSSGYIYTPPPNTTEAQYWVSVNASLWNGGMSACTDHTSGSGNYMMVNGAGVPGTSVWCQTISVTPNTDYDFSAWATSLYPNSPAILQFSINGVLLGSSFTLPSTPCLWTQFFNTWNSGTNTSANICIVNQNTMIGGNDFALDDLTFSPLCSSTDSVTVTVTPPLNVSINPIDTAICQGSSMNLIASGASAFVWDNGSSVNPLTVNPTSTTTYSVVGTTSGCSGSSSVVVTVSPTMTAPTVINNQVSCFGLTDGSATVTPTGGIGNYNYQWLPIGGTSATASNLPLGTYTVTVTDSIGCTATASVIITQPTAIAGTLAPVDEHCPASCDGQITSSISGGTPPLAYLWSNGATTATITDLCSGNYVVTVTDANNCQFINNSTITNSSSINASFTSDGVWGVVPYTINLTYNGSVASTYQWNFGDGSPIDNSQNPSHTYTILGVYTVTLIVTTGSPDFCTDTITMLITVEETSMIEIPNVFTPNGDGFNDVFTVKSKGLATIDGIIFNRWGKQIGKWNTVDGGWDGKNMNDGKDASDGVYFYVINAAGKDKVEYKYTGSITLIR